MDELDAGVRRHDPISVPVGCPYFMIKRFLGKMFSGRPSGAAQPKVISLKSRGRISRCAVQVCETLQRHDYATYVVGGAVRDLLLGREPKDYDVATEAKPEEVRALFRRSR